MSDEIKILYNFGPFCLDTGERVLFNDGKPVPLKPKVYETLLALVRQSRHVVDKETLMREVWPDTFVEENNLTGNIFALRRALAHYLYSDSAASWLSLYGRRTAGASGSGSRIGSVN